jgi:glycosyltransferase involved in cell wall biosynthesis
MTEANGDSAATKIRLHMPTLPHTLCTKSNTHCAFTRKVYLFGGMMRKVGFEVFCYGVEDGLEMDADHKVEIMTRAHFESLRRKAYFELKLGDDAEAYFADPARQVGDLANWDTTLFREFNRNLKTALKQFYRSQHTDIVCLPFGAAHDGALRGEGFVAVETGIGYPNAKESYLIFESYAWLHHYMGTKQNNGGNNYHFVIPNYYDPLEWPLSTAPKPDMVGFLGRLNTDKGLQVLVALAKVNPDTRFVICGQGQHVQQFLSSPNIEYRRPICGTERAHFFGSCIATMCPSAYVEPFCGSGVESQLCGTPVLSTDFGAFSETVEQGKTGLRCHTLAEFQVGLDMARAGKFDREYIRNRAVSLYSMDVIGPRYAHAFKTIMDLWNGNNGWYSKDSHLVLASNHQ